MTAPNPGRTLASPVNRRKLLQWGGLGSLGLTAPALGGCAGAGASGPELSFMFWGSSYEKDAIDEMLAQFEEYRSEAELSVRSMHTPEEYDTRVNTLVASDQLPDVAYMGTGQAYRLAEQGKLVNIVDHFDAYPQLAERLPSTYFWWEDGKCYGTQTANEVILLWYNRQIFAEANLDPPPPAAASAWSWDDIVSIADQLTFDSEGRHPSESGYDANGVEQFGFSVTLDYAPHWYSLVRSNGGDLADEDGMRYALDSPEAIEVLQNLQDLIYEHRVAPTPAQMEQAPATNVQLQTQRVAMAMDGQWILLDLAQTDLQYGVGVLPSYQEPTSVALGGASVISAASEHPEEALELYVFHNDPEHVDLYRNGLWMPLELKYYQDPKLTNEWVDDDVHPEEYQTAVIDYTLDHSVPPYSQRLKNVLNIDEVLTPALQQIGTNSKPAKEVLENLRGEIEPLLEGWYPTGDL